MTLTKVTLERFTAFAEGFARRPGRANPPGRSGG